ncbi:MAG: hypothetical protein GY953_03650 [bacterium]|nr:hypothetical protein [bacterium]
MVIFESMVGSLLAQLLFWFLLVLAAWLSYVLPVRKRFESFFGLNRSSRIDIVLSNLWKPGHGGGKPWGKIISGDELEAARRLNNVLASASPGFPEFVRGFVDNIWLKDKFQISINVSEEKHSDLSYPGNLFVIGSTNKNSARRHYLQGRATGLIIEGESPTPITDIHKNLLKSDFIVRVDGRDTKSQIRDGCSPALIERFVTPTPQGDGMRVVFIFAGRKARDSRAAVRYLARNWKKLQKESKRQEAEGKDHFAKCIVLGGNGEFKFAFDPPGL